MPLNIYFGHFKTDSIKRSVFPEKKTGEISINEDGIDSISMKAAAFE